ncbi:MAG: CRISPR-associated protein Cas4, partial [Chloroflexi bacterium]|nr:CRISPR-associated protein Cas4 [Chloroflexota bacterium]
MTAFLIVLVFVIVVAALVLLALARLERERTGVPVGARVVYSDSGAWEKIERPLFSRRYGLTGKPDYIIAQEGAVIPIEVKPNRTAPAPRDSDVMQLAAYALLVEEAYGTAPAYGLLKYRDVVFQVDVTEELRQELMELMAAMRHDEGARDVARSHARARRCQACGYRGECGQAL